MNRRMNFSIALRAALPMLVAIAIFGLLAALHVVPWAALPALLIALVVYMIFVFLLLQRRTAAR